MVLVAYYNFPVAHNMWKGRFSFADKAYSHFFMSFCPTLSTLCSQVVFHNIPQMAKERDKKSSVKSTQRYKK